MTARRRRAADGPGGQHLGELLPLERKLGALRDVLRTIARERRVVTYRQALSEGLAA